MRIPYYQQETSWSCGAAAMRMALAALGIKRSESQLRRMLKTNRRYGTPNRAFPEIAERLKLSYAVYRNADIFDIERLMKAGFTVIVGFTRPDDKEKEGHIAVVRHVDRTKIYLLDPFYGPDISYGRDAFKKMWKSWFAKDKGDHGWFIALKRKI